MDIRNVTQGSATPVKSQTSNKAKQHDNAKGSSVKESTAKDDVAAVYEKSEQTNASEPNKTSKKAVDKSTIDQLKAEADRRTQTLRNLVKEMLLKQGVAVDESNFYRTIKEGNYEVSDEVRLQAQKDIAEDGYYGVKQTSDRLVSFAKALTGGDPSKADEMIDAVLKGFNEATKVWGSELPEISKRTLEETTRKLEEWKSSMNSNI